MRSLRIRVVAADIAAAVAKIMIAAVVNTVKANAIAMNILTNITIMTNMSLKLIA